MMNDTAMNDFHECLFSLELADVPFLGPLFTWMNRQAGDNFIARKLDRCLQNECSLDLFPHAFTEVLLPGFSDHCPFVTSLKANPDPGPRKLFPFKFFNFWADHPDFIGLVKEAWSIEVFGTPMFRLTRKLKGVKAILKAFNFRSFGRLHERVVAAREALYQAQSALLNNPSNPMLGENEKSWLKNYHDLAIAEEGFLKQKSRIQWLKLGDHNSSFFHKAVKVRNARSALKVITMANGCRTEDPAAIKQESVRHFQGILCSDDPSVSRLMVKTAARIYKCISKIIATRIKQCIPDIISPSQSAFVQGRAIADNVLITQDLMLNYHRDTGPPRCALKVDIMKAYDTISWGCIMNILSCMGTPTHLLRCIKACITTPSFSISVNG